MRMLIKLLNISQKSLTNIQTLFKSDIRSMVNLLQTNQDIVKNHTEEQHELNIIDSEIWDSLIQQFVSKQDLNNIKGYIDNITNKYNINKKNIIKDFIIYITRMYPKYISCEFLKFTENLMHSDIQNSNIHISYSLSKLSTFLTSSV